MTERRPATVTAAALLTEFGDQFLSVLRILGVTLVGCVRSILPSGFLPRKKVEGEIVLITGSGNGLGRLLAVEFGKLGSRLVLWDVNEKQNEETNAILERMGVKSYPYTIDLSDRKQIYSTAARVKQEVGTVDILVNNAGIVSGKKLFDCPDELMEKTMAINANALFYTAKAFVPEMLKRNHGQVVTVASMAGHIGVNGLVDYCASKHAAVGFNEALRSEVVALGKTGVAVTTVNPYYINTGMFDGVKTAAPIMFPILSPDYVISRTMEAILTEADAVYLPFCCNLYLFLRGILPTKAMQLLVEFYGLNRAMDNFRGRRSG